MRKNTRAVRIGGVTVGGGNPVAVQSMLNVPIHDIAGNVAQAKRLEAEGCQIVRVTVPSVADVPVVEALKNAVKMPVVADIHFDYKVALACAEAGVDKIRINRATSEMTPMSARSLRPAVQGASPSASA